MTDWVDIAKRRIQDDGGDTDARRMFSEAIGVSDRTMRRYLTGEAKPNKEIVEAMEFYEPALGSALRDAFPDFYMTMEQEIKTLTAPFYARVHEALEYVNQSDAFVPVTKLIMDLLVNQIDPSTLPSSEDEGIIVLMGQLEVPPGAKKASFLMMHAWSSCGTGIWFENTVRQSYAVGDASLSAVALQQGEPALYPRDLPVLFRVPEMPHIGKINSALAYPIRLKTRLAGVVYIASTQVSYFTRYRREVIRHYARMLSLVFDKDDFYAKDEINFSFISDDIEMRYLTSVAFEYLDATIDELKEHAIERIQKFVQQ